jgi:hypothetical protein
VIQQEQFQGSADGGGLHVRWVLDPGDRTKERGLRGLVIEFVIHQERPDPPILAVYRNRREIERRMAFNGKVPSTLKPGKAYQFAFRLFIGTQEIPGTPYFTVHNPPADGQPMGSEVPQKRMSKAAQRRSAEQMRNAEYETIRMLEQDPAKQKLKMAEVDQQIVEKYGDAE